VADDLSGTNLPSPLVLIVVNYASHALVEANLSGLARSTSTAVQVVIVDNYSTPSERLAISAVGLRHGWAVVALDDNRGFAAGCNAGMRWAERAGARYAVLLNPDARASGDVVQALGQQLAEEPLTLVAPHIVTPHGGSYFHGTRVDLRSGRMVGRPHPGPDTPSRLYVRSPWPLRDWLTAACLGLSVELWERVNGFDEDYFLYWEDVDFSQRCAAAGARLCVRNDLHVIHDEGATHGEPGSRTRSSTYYYYNCRNRLVYAAKHLSSAALLRWILSSPRESWKILMRGGKRQLLTSPRPLWAAGRGTVAGFSKVIRHVATGA
jgi:N-acetylglucosaminyl-diphospho-decaprenol L-rhamnosyltransferase